MSSAKDRKARLEDKLVAVLRDGKARTVSDLVAREGMPRSTIQTMLRALVAAGYLTRTRDNGVACPTCGHVAGPAPYAYKLRTEDS